VQEKHLRQVERAQLLHLPSAKLSRWVAVQQQTMHPCRTHVPVSAFSTTPERPQYDLDCRFKS
jgi:hypothetical protein